MRLTSTLLGLSCGLLLACGGGGSSTCDPSTVTGTDSKFATNALLLPISGNKYAIDIDGDGNVDNGLANLLSTVASAGSIDLQTPVNMAIAMGEAIILADVKTSSLTDASCSSVTLNLAKTTAAAPKFDGSDMFTIAGSGSTPTPLGGAIKAGVLNTTLPKDMGPMTSTVPTFTLSIALAGAQLSLKLWGAHIQGTVSASGIANGQIHGVILNSDITGTIIPTVATLVTQLIQKDPTGSTASTVIGLLETDKNGPCHTMPATCTITPAEISSNPIIGALLAPDVRVHDSSGNWKPSLVTPSLPADALSVGLGFTSVKASF